MHFSNNNEDLVIGDNTYRVVPDTYREMKVRLYTSHGRKGKGKERHDEFKFVICGAHNIDCDKYRVILGCDGANMVGTYDRAMHGLTPVEPKLYTDGQIHMLSMIGVRHKDNLKSKSLDLSFMIIMNLISATGSEKLNPNPDF